MHVLEAVGARGQIGPGSPRDIRRMVVQSRGRIRAIEGGEIIHIQTWPSRRSAALGMVGPCTASGRVPPRKQTLERLHPPLPLYPRRQDIPARPDPLYRLVRGNAPDLHEVPDCPWKIAPETLGSVGPERSSKSDFLSSSITPAYSSSPGSVRGHNNPVNRLVLLKIARKNG